jgi:hypothetical protein
MKIHILFLSLMAFSFSHSAHAQGQGQGQQVRDVTVVGGNIQVDNFPDTQTITGNVRVNNFPAIQRVKGKVSITNLPAVQSVETKVSPYMDTSFEGFRGMPGQGVRHCFFSFPSESPAGTVLRVTGISGYSKWGNVQYLILEGFSERLPSVNAYMMLVEEFVIPRVVAPTHDAIPGEHSIFDADTDALFIKPDFTHVWADMNAQGLAPISDLRVAVVTDIALAGIPSVDGDTKCTLTGTLHTRESP